MQIKIVVSPYLDLVERINAGEYLQYDRNQWNYFQLSFIYITSICIISIAFPQLTYFLTMYCAQHTHTHSFTHSQKLQKKQHNSIKKWRMSSMATNNDDNDSHVAAALNGNKQMLSLQVSRFL